MARSRVLALVLAGGEGGRLDALTDERAKPAVPFAGVYRLIDFPLSNCMHSGIDDVWVVQQYQAQSLTEYLANGRPWDLDRTHGGLRLIQPYLGHSESGWYRGNADAIYRNKADIERFDPDLLLVLSADHLYKLDYGEVIERHLERDADATLVTTKVPLEEAGRFGTVEVDGDGNVTAFAYKPEEPTSDLVTTEVFVYETSTLLGMLAELANDDSEDEDTGLEDFGHELLPRLVERGRVAEYRLDGYWRDVGTVDSYFGAHMEQLEPEPLFRLDDPAWPIHTWSVQRPPARILSGARVSRSLVSPGCFVAGRLASTVLGPGVVVEDGASINCSILLGDTTVRRGAEIDRAIVDVGAEIGESARVAGEGAEIAVIAQGQRVT